MSELNELKQVLADCKIDFDREILVTDLLQEFKLSYEQTNEALAEYLAAQEKKHQTKYEKRFLVQGMDKNDDTEVYTVKSESKIKEWLDKLSNAQSMLYSVKIKGSKPLAADFKPMIKSKVQLSSLTVGKRPQHAASQNAADSSLNTKKEAAQSARPLSNGSFQANAAKKNGTTTSSNSTTVTSKPKEEKISPEQKSKKEATKKKAGIGNFFAAAASSSGATKPNHNDEKAVVKPPTPKKMQDFFKKGPIKAISPKKETMANTSMQLFADEDENDAPAAESSDEEETIEALKLQMAADEDTEVTIPNKRRRIIDSDDEEDDVEPPQKKTEAQIKEEPVEEQTTTTQSETYLDEDGFVITVKSKKTVTKSTKSPKSPVSKKSPPVNKSTSLASNAKSKPAAGKTKQGDIMNFFTKK